MVDSIPINRRKMNTNQPTNHKWHLELHTRVIYEKQGTDENRYHRDEVLKLKSEVLCHADCSFRTVDEVGIWRLFVYKLGGATPKNS